MYVLLICKIYSKECQVKHWKEHKTDCTWIKTKHDKWKDARNNLPEGTQLDTKEGPCAICLEETITNPVVLPCGHVFCFRCMGSYQGSSDSEECPYCRGEIPNVGEKAAERMSLYSKRAEASPKGSDECIKYAKLALAENQAIFELMEKDELELLVGMKYIRAELTSMTDQPLETIKMTKELLLLYKKYHGILNFDRVADTKCLLAEAYAARGKWDKAVEIYRSAYESYVQNEETPGIFFIVGLCQALYERRMYDEAIKMGKEVGIDMAREWAGVHKYVALSQKAKGDIDGAKLTMSRAILYEEHWDEDNLQNNKQLLRELNDL